MGHIRELAPAGRRNDNDGGSCVTMPQRFRGSGFARGAAVPLLALVLAACGELPDTGTEVTPPVPLSPIAGEIPEETFAATATIEGGRLQPDRFGGVVGTAFQLVITGDGTEHTLVIQELVAETPIAAEGETTISFTIVGDPGELEITLDGEPAGIFERQSPGGATDV
jgi:hypothetical protein